MSKPSRPYARFFRQRIVAVPMYSLFLVMLAWLVGSLSLWIAADIPPGQASRTADIWGYTYPELVRAKLLDPLPQVASELGADDSQAPQPEIPLRVLLLGGSVLQQAAGELKSRIESLPTPGHRKIEVHDLTYAARTSRDSMLKREFLNDQHFDVVIVYHGMNDVRMNCCPSGEFENDYRHCRFYHAFHARLDRGTLNAQDIFLETGRFWSPLGEPKIQDLNYGSDIRTPGPFRANLQRLIRTTRGTGGQTLLMSFATHLPENYSREAYLAKQLDYGVGDFSMPAEAWGLPENVRRTVAAHNDVIRGLAEAEEGVRFLDVERMLPPSGEIFSDPCHLTPAGIARFAELTTTAAADMLSEASSTAGSN